MLIYEYYFLNIPEAIFEEVCILIIREVDSINETMSLVLKLPDFGVL